MGCREGPLCDEPMRQVKIRVIDAIISSDPICRGGGQIIPTARRAANSAFLSACPRLLEPYVEVEVVTLEDTVRAIYKIFAHRRGKIINERGKPGTPFHVLFTVICQPLSLTGLKQICVYEPRVKHFVNRHFIIGPLYQGTLWMMTSLSTHLKRRPKKH